MTKRRLLRKHVSLVLLLCVTVEASGAFSNSYSPSLFLMDHERLQLLLCMSRGGGGNSETDKGGGSTDTDDANENEAIDSYIEELIGTVEDDSCSTSESSYADVVRESIEISDEQTNVVHPTIGVFEHVKQQTTIESHNLKDNNSNDNVSGMSNVEENAPAQETRGGTTLTDSSRERIADVKLETERETGESEVQANDRSEETLRKRKKRRKRPLAVDTETHVRNNEADAMTSNAKTVEEQQQDESPEQQRHPQQATLGPPQRPNALYRFLLHQGRVGHVLVMICVLITEIIQTYIPPLAHLIGYILSFFLSSDDQSLERGRSAAGARRAGSTSKTVVNAQYAAFVSSDGSTVRGKQRKQQVRKADQQAAEKLRRVGSIQDAKFRHVSQDFMKRHRIGSFRDSNPNNAEQGVVVEEYGTMGITTPLVEEEESDVDWVVEALSVEKEEAPIAPNSIKPSFGVSVESDHGATISVGVEFGGTANRKKRRKSLAEAATERTPQVKQRPVGPRSSDRDGGGGVIGRIRAAGANSLVSRSLLGAYPGDAVPPSEAGSANGVIALAEKYGYGDWSDDDEEDEDDPFLPGNPPKRVKRKQRRRTTRNQPPPSRGVSVQFDVSSSTSSSNAKPTAQRPSRSTTSKKARSAIKDHPVSSAEKSEILLGSPARQLSERRKRVEVRPPMEKLNEARAKSRRSKDHGE